MRTLAITVMAFFLVNAGALGQASPADPTTSVSPPTASVSPRATSRELVKNTRTPHRNTREELPVVTTPALPSPQPAPQPQPPVTDTRRQERFDLEREMQQQHEVTLIRLTADSVRGIHERLDSFAMVGVIIVVLSIIAATFSALAYLKVSRLRPMHTSHVSHSRSRSFNYMPDEGESWPRGGQTGGGYPNTGTFGSFRDDPKIEEPTPDPKPQIKGGIPLPHGYAKSSKGRMPRRSQTLIDTEILMKVGAACLRFPQSLESFRRLWEQHGGEKSVEILGFGNTEDEPAVILVADDDSTLFAVPNTNHWTELADTGLFEPDGRVGPGSKVKELLTFARAKRTRQGDIVPLSDGDFGRVRVDL